MVRRRPSSQTREERQRERDDSSVTFMGVLFLGIALLMIYALVAATINGNGPGSAWLLVPLAGGIVCFLGLGLTVFGSWADRLLGPMMMGGLLVLVGGLALGLLIAPDEFASPSNSRGPQTVEGARILGAILAAPLLWLGFVQVRSRWRRRR